MSNALISETSPYLRQHAENPVNWYPWCEEAFEKAKNEHKPVFLSIGYSTCHWCHVMAEESFSDRIIAEILNREYVSIKVDREERPDIDSVYMRACTLLNGSGGWPLTVVMTPEKEPFFVGTYIPRDNGGGRTGLISLLSALAARWKKNGAELVRTAREICACVEREEIKGGADASTLPERAAEQLMRAYDGEYGGFGTAPKFPSAHNLIFLMRASKLTGEKKLREALENTLRQMYRGGIYDHFGGGFCRYSTDREWLAPHFEKTLYDNALLAFAYTEAWQDGHMALWRTVAEDTLDYCLRELKSEGGGFFCAQDADSGGREGAYYLFDPEEIKALLGEDDGRHFCECYDITPEGNFRGRSIPNLLLNTRWNFLPESYGEFRERLRIYREQRMSLFTDRKMLCSWNGLMLCALSRAAYAFNDARYLYEAGQLAEFMENDMRADGALRACRCENSLRFDARLDDCAFYALGLLELYNADHKAERIERAQALAEKIISDFSDERGGYCLTADRDMPVRPKEVYDGALPSGNTAALELFDRLFRLTGSAGIKKARDALLEYLSSYSADYPAGICAALSAPLIANAGGREAVCVLNGDRLPDTLRAVTSRYAPELSLLIKTPENAELLSRIAPFTADMRTINGKAALYLCTGTECSAPVALE